MSGQIVLIDDEKLVMKYYIRAMEERGYTVKQLYDPDSAFEYLQTKPKLIAAILDIMMKSGDIYKGKETDAGLKTGVLLYEDVRKMFPDLPIIVLTNVTNNGTLDSFPKHDKLKILKKLEYPPFDLVDEVDKMIEK